MITTRLLRSSIVLAGFALMAALQLQASTNVLFFDPFTAPAGSAFNNSAPQDHGGVGTDLWYAPDDGMVMDGSSLTVTSGSRWAALPFYPVDGNKYKLSADLNPTHTGSDWFAVGFSQTPTPVADYGVQVLSGWFLDRGLNPGAPLHSFLGYGTDGGGTAGEFTGLHNLAVILDATVANWTFEFFVDGISQRGPVPFSATPDVNPIIGYVTFGSYGSARGTIDNFKLENIFQVDQGAPTIMTPPQDATVVIGGTAKFSVLAAGPKPITYQWFKGTQELVGEINSTLTLMNLTVADNGSKYIVKVSNSYGTTTATAATLTVLDVAGPLIHKFNFTDGTANDSVGGMKGVFKGTAKVTDGQLVLDGSEGGYVLLSDYAMPPTGSASVVAWFRASTALGNAARIFDFGSGTLNYLYFSPMTGGNARFAMRTGTDVDTGISATPALNDNLVHMVAAVIDSTPTETGLNGTMVLYIDGVPVGTNDLNGTITLSGLDSGPQNFIGKSQWVNTGDALFKGFIDEVRVYNTALSQDDILGLAPDANPNAAPVIDTEPTDTVANVGGTASFVVGVTGSLPMTYKWRFNGADIASSDANPFVLANVKTADFGEYSVVVANSFGSVTSAVARLSLNRWSYAPWSDDTTSGVDTNYFYTHAYNFGTTASTDINGLVFTGIGGGSPAVAGSFTLTGVPNVFNNDANNIPEGSGSRILANDFIYGGAPGTLTLQGLTPGREYLLTLYSVAFDAPGARRITFSAPDQSVVIDQDVYGNDNGIRISYQYIADANGSVVITHAPVVAGATHHSYGFCNRLFNKIGTEVAPEIVTQPEDTSAAVDSSGGFTVAALGTEPLHYQWRFNGTKIAGAPDSKSYTIDNVQVADFGGYSVVVANNFGSVTSVVAQLSLLRFSSTNWVDDASTGIDTNYVYTHAYNLGSIVGTTINDLAFTGTVGGNPSVAGSFAITGVPNVLNNDVNNLVDVGSRILANDFIYGGNPGVLTLYGLTPGKKYLLTYFSVGWDDSGRVIRFSAADGQHYTVDQDTYGLDNGIQISYQYTADANGSVSVTNVQAGAQGTFHTYGFVNRLLNKVGVADPAEISAEPQDTSAVVGGSGSFAVIAIGTPPLTYQWRFNGVNIPGANESGYTNNNVQTTNFGGYSVVVANNFGSVTSVVAQLSLTRFSSTNWTDDASSGISSQYVYTHAYNFGSTINTTINGVAFTGIAVGNPSVSNVFEITGVPNVFNNDNANLLPVGTGSRLLANDFIYGGNPGVLKLYGLTPGNEYLLTYFSTGWDDSGRLNQFTAAGGQQYIVDQDSYGIHNGILINYQYIADASGTVSITNRQAGTQGTFHTYGFANRLVSAVAQPPRLTITVPGNGSVTLSWPVAETGYVLESATSLPAASWTPVAGVQNNQATVIHSQTGTQFFRLRKP